MKDNEKATEDFYQPFDVFKTKKRLLLLLLNLPFEKNYLFSRLWENGCLKLCCDGGANKLYEAMLAGDCKSQLVPDFICGDFDSLRDDVKTYFADKGSRLVSLGDQNYTDFTKTAMFGIEHCIKEEIEYDAIVAYPAIGGRLDQTFANINTLYKINKMTDKPCYLLSHVDITFLIDQGVSRIEVGTGFEGKECGLVPIGHKADHVTTSGFLYNLNNQPMEFGSLISTSNSLLKDQKEVTVKTSHPLLITLGYTYQN